MLNTLKLEHHYTVKDKISFPDMVCNAGDTMLILGQSGVGKTTLLHILGGLLRPTKGSVSVDGKNMYDISSSKMDAYRGEHIGIIFQQAHFVQALTVKENLLLAQQMGGKKDIVKIDQLLNSLNITHKANKYPENLSQGEKQRAAIARALVNSPKIILADEPTSALDDNNCNEVIQLLEQQAKEANAALIIVTHDNRLTKTFANQIILQ
jgi:putative ABC transport system ATP-binding protein